MINISNFKAFLFVIVILSFSIHNISATEQFALHTGKNCSFCHVDKNGGGLNNVGFAYIKNGYHYPIPEKILKATGEKLSAGHQIFYIFLRYLHIIASVILLGAIFYIHIFIKPVNITGGIPGHERILGLTCLFLTALTGLFLTLNRIHRFEQFFNNTFGFILFIKIGLFVLMLLVALLAVTVIHKKMKNEQKALPGSPAELTHANLPYCNGQSGAPAYIVYENKIFDVSRSSRWKDGVHFKKHRAGSDLTEAIKGAPHGPEVLDKVGYMGEMDLRKKAGTAVSPARKIFIVMAYTNLILIFFILLCIALWRSGVQFIPSCFSERGVASAQSCIKCHKNLHPGICSDWKRSMHSYVGTDCYKCHQVPSPASTLVNKEHLGNYEKPISIVVSPKVCAGCHHKEYNEYKRSKHANTLEIIWKVDKWLQYGMNNTVERTVGCFACHGSVVRLKNGKPLPGTWPNVGVGRKNPDNSLGSCTSCHTRHRFSITEARKPEACDQCHLGPDHPQIEIYNESKHGTIYHAEGNEWNWKPDDGKWKAGRDYRAPTCASCHMSKSDSVAGTHDVTERLSWETQAPLTVRPNEFKPFPAKTVWKEERNKMEKVCKQCHSGTWTNGHFTYFDSTVYLYNQVYYLPAEKKMSRLYKIGLLSSKSYFDEELEWEFYELWHHEGRRARMGSAMMAPDYAWWHGFYELKHRLVRFMENCGNISKSKRNDVFSDFPGQIKHDKKEIQ